MRVFEVVARFACLALGWCFLIVGMASIVLSNHSVDRMELASPEWWASAACFPIAALFFVANALLAFILQKAE